MNIRRSALVCACDLFRGHGSDTNNSICVKQAPRYRDLCETPRLAERASARQVNAAQ